MICSDGLSPVVSFGAIRDALASAADPSEAVRHLVGLAEAAGAPDNITVIVTDVRAADSRIHGRRFRYPRRGVCRGPYALAVRLAAGLIRPRPPC